MEVFCSEKTTILSSRVQSETIFKILKQSSIIKKYFLQKTVKPLPDIFIPCFLSFFDKFL